MPQGKERTSQLTETARSRARLQGRLAATPQQLFAALSGCTFTEIKTTASLTHVSPCVVEYRDAKGALIGTAYYCDYCQGWIKGSPYEAPFNTLAPRTGVQGREKFCRVCHNGVGYSIDVVA